MKESKSFEEIYAEYDAAVKAIPRLHIGEDLELARHWRDDGDQKARNRLAESHLGLVLRAVRKASRKYGLRWDQQLSLVAAGNAGLFHATFLFDPELGRRFATHAWPWISKEVWRQARFDRSSVDRPDNVRCFRDPLGLGHWATVGGRSMQIDYTDFALPRGRSLCITPSSEDLDHGDPSTSVVVAISNAFAMYRSPDEVTPEAAHVAIEEDEVLSGRLDDLHALLAAKADQILDPRDREIYRARYLFPVRKTKLKDLAKRYGVSEARISQIAVESDRNVRAAIASDPLADCYREVRFPTWRTIEDWCDHTKEARKKSLEEWSRGGDQNINRVQAAIDAGVEANDIGGQLEIPTATAEDPSFNPAAHLVKLAEWRRIAEEQDREQRERLERYLEHKSLEQRVTLTTKGYGKARELERTGEAENGPKASAGEHSAPSKGARSVA